MLSSLSNSRTVALPRVQSACSNCCSRGPRRGLELEPKMEKAFVIQVWHRRHSRARKEYHPIALLAPRNRERLGRDGDRQNLFDVDLGGIVPRITGRAVRGLIPVRAGFLEAFE